MEVIQETAPKAKVYSENAFLIATILGGPLAAVYMYIANMKVMGRLSTRLKYGVCLSEEYYY